MKFTNICRVQQEGCVVVKNFGFHQCAGGANRAPSNFVVPSAGGGLRPEFAAEFTITEFAKLKSEYTR